MEAKIAKKLIQIFDGMYLKFRTLGKMLWKILLVRESFSTVFHYIIIFLVVLKDFLFYSSTRGYHNL
jgi:hypothetical protein